MQERNDKSTRNDQWLAKLSAAVEFTAVWGNPPRQNSKDPNERSLAWWILIQRRSLKKGTLTPHRLALLDHRLPQWRVTSYEQAWNDQHATVVKFLDAHGRYPRQSSKDRQERNLALWVDGQRQRRKSGRLSPARIQALQELPDWRWEVVKRHGWENNLAALIEFCRTEQRPPNYQSKGSEEWRLHKWLMRQREAYRAGKLAPAKVSKLNAQLPQWNCPRPGRHLWETQAETRSA